MPPTHCSLELQLCEQVPQFEKSLLKLKHDAPQVVAGGVHSALHTPASQTRPAPQAMPQPPQLLALDWVLTHWLLQRVVLPVHWHSPPTQLLPAPQLLPHAPQLLGSNCVSVHNPLHRV